MKDFCESQAERELLYHMNRWFDWGTEIEQQVVVGNYRVDFVAEGVAVEIDGKDFHDPSKDAVRAWKP